MKSKSIVAMTAAAVAAFVAAFSASRDRAAAGEVVVSADEYPEIGERVNDVAEVQIVSNEHTSTIRRAADGWVLAEKSDYPVKPEQIREAIVRIARFEVMEPKTAKPENFAALGLQDPETDGSVSKRVTLRDGDGGEIASLLLGNTKFYGRRPTLFVRPSDANQTYQVEGRVSAEADPLTWIDREVLKLDGNQVANVVIEHADGDLVRIAREAGNDYAVQDIPEGKQEAYSGTSNSTATALSYLRLDDVRPRAEVDLTLEPVAKATYICEDGLVITLEMGKVDGQTWTKLDATFQAPDAGEASLSEEGEETSGGLTEEELEHARVEARKLQRRFDPWAYQLPDFKATAIAKKTSDLLTDIVVEEPAESADGLPTPDPSLPGSPQDE